MSLSVENASRLGGTVNRSTTRGIVRGLSSSSFEDSFDMSCQCKAFSTEFEERQTLFEKSFQYLLIEVLSGTDEKASRYAHCRCRKYGKFKAP